MYKYYRSNGKICHAAKIILFQAFSFSIYAHYYNNNVSIYKYKQSREIEPFYLIFEKKRRGIEERKKCDTREDG